MAGVSGIWPLASLTGLDGTRDRAVARDVPAQPSCEFERLVRLALTDLDKLRAHPAWATVAADFPELEHDATSLAAHLCILLHVDDPCGTRLSHAET